MDWLEHIFRTYPSIPIFLTIGLGFWLGKLKYKSISLGSVTAVLLVGVVIGQMNIPIGAPLKSLFFLLFLFAIGYRCGPQFAAAIKGQGLKQILFAVIICLICFVTAGICAKIMGYNPGIAAGFYAGTQTLSPVIGVASDAIGSLSVPEQQKQAWINLLPVCYAVTYIYGALGAVWILGTLGPIMLGGLEKVRKQTKELEKELSHSTLGSDPAFISGNSPVVFRAYKVTAEHFATPQTVAQVEEHFQKLGRRIFVERIRDANGAIHATAPETIIRPGDEIVLSGRHEFIIGDESWIGPEVDDAELLTFVAERTKVMATKKVAGLTLDELRRKPFMYGVIIESISRDEGLPVPVLPGARLMSGDMLTIVGLPQEVQTALPGIGIEEKPTDQTDMIFLCLALAIGTFVGALTVRLGGIPVSLSTSGGALVAGIFFGWLRTKYPAVGAIPSSSLWLLNNLGLNMFIAVIGIQAGPSFVTALKEVGGMLLVMGFFATSIPLFLAIFIGDKIFHFHPAINLGCCAGGRKSSPGFGAVASALDSHVPALGYTITYAVANTCSIFLGVAMVLLFA